MGLEPTTTGITIQGSTNWAIATTAILKPLGWTWGTWRARQDSNLRPLAPEANALSSWATGALSSRRGEY